MVSMLGGQPSEVSYYRIFIMMQTFCLLGHEPKKSFLKRFTHAQDVGLEIVETYYFRTIF